MNYELCYNFGMIIQNMCFHAFNYIKFMYHIFNAALLVLYFSLAILVFYFYRKIVRCVRCLFVEIITISLNKY